MSDAVRGMDLMHRDEARAGEHRCHGTPAILGDQRGIVARAQPDVEAGHVAGRDAALAAEKAVRDPGQRPRAENFCLTHSLRLINRSSSACSPTMKA